MSGCSARFLLLATLTLTSSAQADTYLTTSSQSALSRVNSANGSGAIVGFTGWVVNGATFDLDGRMIVVMDNGVRLGTASLTNGAVTVRCVLGGSSLIGIDVSRSGVLYGVDGAGVVYTINKTTCAKTPIGNTGAGWMKDLA